MKKTLLVAAGVLLSPNRWTTARTARQSRPSLRTPRAKALEGRKRAAEGEVKADVLDGKDYALLTIGRKAEGYFKFRGYNIATSYGGFSDSPTYAHAREIGQDVVARYVAGEFTSSKRACERQ